MRSDQLLRLVFAIAALFVTFVAAASSEEAKLRVGESIAFQKL